MVRIGVRLRVRIRVRVRVRGLTLTLTLTLTPTLSLTLTGALRHLDLRDQHDEPQRFCAGIVFQRLPHAAVKWITPFAAPHICWPRAAEEKNDLCSGSSCFDESNEVRGGDAQGGAAHGGPGCEEGAGERGGGGWDSGEGSGSSNGVVVERGSRHDPGAQSGAVAKPSIQASFDQVWRGRDCFSCSSHLTCQRNHTQARPLHCVMLWCHDVVRVSHACCWPAGYLPRG